MIAIVLHLHYQDLWGEFKDKIVPLLSDKVHLYVTVNEFTPISIEISNYAKDVYILENRGADFGPFVYTYNKIRNLGYKYIFKVHGKKSLHNTKIGNTWRKRLTEVLIENEDVFNSVVSAMDKDSRIFMAGAYSCFYDRAKEPIDGKGRTDCLPYIDKLNEYVNIETHGCFIAGSMFAVTTEYLEILFKDTDLDKLYNNFRIGYFRESSLEHAMERMIGYGVEYHKGKFLIINPSE